MWFTVLIGDALHLPSWLPNVLPFSATPYMRSQKPLGAHGSSVILQVVRETPTGQSWS